MLECDISKELKSTPRPAFEEHEVRTATWRSLSPRTTPEPRGLFRVHRQACSFYVWQGDFKRAVAKGATLTHSFTASSGRQSRGLEVLEGLTR